jgi:hypothetical protein
MCDIILTNVTTTPVIHDTSRQANTRIVFCNPVALYRLAGPPRFGLGKTGGACKMAFCDLASSMLIPSRSRSAGVGRSTVHPKLLKISLTLESERKVIHIPRTCLI